MLLQRLNVAQQAVVDRPQPLAAAGACGLGAAFHRRAAPILAALVSFCKKRLAGKAYGALQRQQ